MKHLQNKLFKLFWLLHCFHPVCEAAGWDVSHKHRSLAPHLVRAPRGQSSLFCCFWSPFSEVVTVFTLTEAEFVSRLKWTFQVTLKNQRNQTTAERLLQDRLTTENFRTNAPQSSGPFLSRVIKLSYLLFVLSSSSLLFPPPPSILPQEKQIWIWMSAGVFLRLRCTSVTAWFLWIRLCWTQSCILPPVFTVTRTQV